MGKIKTLNALKKITGRLKKQKKIIVFTNGCFDLIHPGHIKVLKKAKSKGDILIVGLNSDASVKKIKGRKRPVLNQQARAKVLEAFEFIDYIVLFSEDTPNKLIKKIRPDYLVKGGDWKKEEIIGGEFVKKIFRVELEGDYSTSDIIKKIQKLK